MKRFVLSLALVLAALGARPVTAQQLPEPGARVRLTVPISVSSGRVIGTLTAVDSTRLVVSVASSGEQFEIPRALVSRLEVSQGHSTPRDATLRGTVRGAQAGAIFIGGTATAFLTVGYLFRSEGQEGDAGDLLRYSAIATGGGAVLGALAGGVFGGRATERWQTVEMGSLALYWPGGREVGLALSF